MNDRALSIAGGSGAMFDRIAERYDLVNRVMSLGGDRSWRRRLVKETAAHLGEGEELLDVATGTADVAIAAATKNRKIQVVGIDPSKGMLEIGRKKVKRSRLDDRVTLVEGDARSLPFEDGRFSAVTIAFGIRNVPDRKRALREMARVLEPGGALGVLELTEPIGPHAPLVRLWVHRAVPVIGAWLASDKEYEYLSRSIAAFPPAFELAAMIRDTGFEHVRVRSMSFGAVHLFVAVRSETSRSTPPR
jgi:demethylmenaquinone methyltransferase / 2-methoxy-6-polyprenyl-1,4-benzoquinol methylase